MMTAKRLQQTAQNIGFPQCPMASGFALQAIGHSMVRVFYGQPDQPGIYSACYTMEEVEALLHTQVPGAVYSQMVMALYRAARHAYVRQIFTPKS